MAVNGIQYELVPYEPDIGGTGGATIVFTGAAGARVKRFFIPCRPTADEIKLSQYNLSLLITPITAAPPNPKPGGCTIRIGIYRRVGSTNTLAASTVAELVKGSTHTVTLPGLLANLQIANMDATILEPGGCFWIVIQVEDLTASGLSAMSFTFDGATASDANITHQWYKATPAAGALPATIAGNTLTATVDMPFLRADWI